MTRPLVATYRLQLDPSFDLDAAAGLVDQLADIGISHVYLSPVFEARAGSTHGYDGTDPGRVRAELGGRSALDHLVAALHARDMGVMADIVPNHLAADAANPWWWRMLREGRESESARVFDVDWDAGDGKVILPVLGDAIAAVLERGELFVDRLEPAEADVTDARSTGERVLRYFDRCFPLAPGTHDLPLAELVDAQHYRLVHWREPQRNYRRFFDIDDLVGVRMEDDAVFVELHHLVLELVADGSFDALRVDHVDGLRAPGRYLERLASAVAGVPVVVEKILGTDEELRGDWPVAGTTGYEHLADLDHLFVDREGLRALDAQYRRAGGRRFRDVDRAARQHVLAELFPSELDARAAEAAVVAGLDWADAREAVEALTLGLDVYRTYLGTDPGAAPGDGPDADDLARLAGAVTRGGATADPAVAAVSAVLTDGSVPAGELVARWQQLTGAVMAKGHEDTAFYRHTRLLALDEVGGDPDGPLTGDPLERFHVRQRARTVGDRPGLTTTATHDTKRGEDARARLLALTELPEEWDRAFQTFHAGLAADLDLDERRFVVQTLLAAWPVDDTWSDFGGRVAAHLRKALREAKRRTDWLDPDEAHEATVLEVADSLLADGGAPFDAVFGTLRSRLSVAGASNALARVVLKCAAPGVPDLYRGCERWDLSLADPDNRRPVDHRRDAAQLAAWATSEPDPAALLEGWPDGRVKLWCTARGLRARRERPDLFVAGDYRPVTACGRHADALVAFAREHGGQHALVVVARRSVQVAGAGAFPTGASWGDTAIELPARGVPMHDVLRPASPPVADTVSVGDLLAVLPCRVAGLRLSAREGRRLSRRSRRARAPRLPAPQPRPTVRPRTARRCRARHARPPRCRAPPPTPCPSGRRAGRR